ncbi:MAG: hypothetical protein ACYDHH_07560 [Solirubrobacteraceae bacterium]
MPHSGVSGSRRRARDGEQFDYENTADGDRLARRPTESGEHRSGRRRDPAPLWDDPWAVTGRGSQEPWSVAGEWWDEPRQAAVAKRASADAPARDRYADVGDRDRRSEAREQDSYAEPRGRSRRAESPSRDRYAEPRARDRTADARGRDRHEEPAGWDPGQDNHTPEREAQTSMSSSDYSWSRETAEPGDDHLTEGPPTGGPPTEGPPTTPVGRRTVTITGRGSDRNWSPTAPAKRLQRRAYDRPGYKPDRAAMWAVLLGVVLLLAAATSSHAAVAHLHHALAHLVGAH